MCYESKTHARTKHNLQRDFKASAAMLCTCTCTHQLLGGRKPHSVFLPWECELQLIFSPDTSFHSVKGWCEFKLLLLFLAKSMVMWPFFHQNNLRRRRRKRKTTSLMEWMCRLRSWAILQQTEPNPLRGDHHQGWWRQHKYVQFWCNFSLKHEQHRRKELHNKCLTHNTTC